jgi:hypothetical protein
MTVTVESALSDVRASARRLSELTRELVLTAVEDQPRHCQVHLVTVVHDAALDVAAEAEQAADAMSREDVPQAAPQMVARCQHHLTSFGEALVRKLAAPEFLNDLAALAAEHGGEVRAWVAEIRRCIQACQLALWTDAQPALNGYWQELADTNRSPMSGDGR